MAGDEHVALVKQWWPTGTSGDSRTPAPIRTSAAGHLSGANLLEADLRERIFLSMLLVKY
jgi:hypothetical protein